MIPRGLFNPHLTIRNVPATLLAVSLLFFAGCYTQLTTIERESPPPREVLVEVDSAGDTTKTLVVREKDTVVVRERDRETCFWTRDFFGRPTLRCYDSWYNRDWAWYHDYPWWYRYNDYYRYGYCPSGTYYDTFCDCCREIGYPDYGSGSPGSTGSVSREPSDELKEKRRPSYGVPGSGAKAVSPRSTPKKTGTTSSAPKTRSILPSGSGPVEEPTISETPPSSGKSDDSESNTQEKRKDDNGPRRRRWR